MNFDRVARHYQWLETLTFGDALQRSRVCWIDKIPRPTRVLIVGEGNGRFLCELLRVYPRIDIDCVDASEQMLRIARSRVQKRCPESREHVHFLRRDILQWSPTGPYDLLVTHFFLDCFSQADVAAIVSKLANAASPASTWLIADFAIPEPPIKRLHAKAWLRLMYSFFRLATGIKARNLVDPAAHLLEHGFEKASENRTQIEMVSSQMLFRAPAPVH